MNIKDMPAWLETLQNVNPELAERASKDVVELLNAVQGFLDVNESKDDFDTKVNMMVAAIKNGKEAIKNATT